MIDGPGTVHWCTFYTEDGEPFGETCRCPVGEDHEEEGLPEVYDLAAAVLEVNTHG